MADDTPHHDTDEQHSWVLNTLGTNTRDPNYAASPAALHDDQPALTSAWDWTKNKAAITAQAAGKFDTQHGHVLTRAAGLAQAVGGAGEALTGAIMAGVGGASTATGVGAAPGLPAMAGGAALAVNGADNAVTGLRTAFTGQFHHTITAQAAGEIAHGAGASDQTAARITNGMDLAQGIAGGLGTATAGIIRKGAADTLVARQTERLAAEQTEQAAAAQATRLPPKPPVINLRGQDYEMPGWKMQPLTYAKRPPEEAKLLRDAFDGGIRRNYLLDLAKNHAETLRAAGLNDEQIARVAAGRVPQGFQVHHRLPLDDGGTNTFDNLVMMRNNPDHMLASNYQRSVTAGLAPGQTREVQWLLPEKPSVVWPETPGTGATPIPSK